MFALVLRALLGLALLYAFVFIWLAIRVHRGFRSLGNIYVRRR